MKEDPDYNEYLHQWSALYEKNNYSGGLAGYYLTRSHEWSEKYFDSGTHFKKVLEVGAGTGKHVQFIQHTYDEYWITDLNLPFLDQVSVRNRKGNNGTIQVQQENALSLSFPDASFDRVIAAHVLEHIYKPHEALREWVRVLKPGGGVLTLILPCDPGVAWRLGRNFFARKKFVDSGMAYDYWMAREHVNPINNLISFVRFYFDDYREYWRPLKVPSMDLNLFYIVHIRI